MSVIPALGSDDRRVRRSGSSSSYIKLDSEFGASLSYTIPRHIKERKYTRKICNLAQCELSWKGESNRDSA